jgi:MlaC protein
VIKRAGLVIPVLVLSVISQGFGDKAAPGDGVTSIADPEIRPLAIVTSSVSRGLASLRSHRVELNTSEDRRAEIRRAADELFDVYEIARRALGQHWKGLLPQEQHEFIRLFRDVLTQSFVTIVQRYTGDNVAFVDEEIAGIFAQVHSRISAERGSETAIIGTSSVAQLLERMRTEPSRRPPSPDAVAGATIAEPETSARGRLAAGLLLGAAAHARWR